MIHRRQRGFTLVELMTVLVIIAVLASMAIPSYRQYIRRANRSEAKTALLENAQFLERNRTVSNSYNLDGASNPVTAESLPVQQSPKDGAARYLITFAQDSPTATTFTLLAVPVDGGPMAGDQCGSFELDERGTKSLVNATATVADCWNK